jgi:hypothetical protein
MKVDRNIHRKKNGMFLVEIFRQRTGSIYGGQYLTLERAIARRDQLDEMYPPRSQGGAPRLRPPGMTRSQLWRHRVQNKICPVCGDPNSSGLAVCGSCRAIRKLKRKAVAPSRPKS